MLKGLFAFAAFATTNVALAGQTYALSCTTSILQQPDSKWTYRIEGFATVTPESVIPVINNPDGLRVAVSKENPRIGHVELVRTARVAQLSRGSDTEAKLYRVLGTNGVITLEIAPLFLESYGIDGSELAGYMHVRHQMDGATLDSREAGSEVMACLLQLR